MLSNRRCILVTESLWLAPIPVTSQFVWLHESSWRKLPPCLLHRANFTFPLAEPPTTESHVTLSVMSCDGSDPTYLLSQLRTRRTQGGRLRRTLREAPVRGSLKKSARSKISPGRSSERLQQDVLPCLERLGQVTAKLLGVVQL